MDIAQLFDGLEQGDDDLVAQSLQSSDPNALLTIEIEACDAQGHVLDRWPETHTPLSWAVGCEASASLMEQLLNAGAQGVVPGVRSPLPQMMAAGHWDLAERLMSQPGIVAIPEQERMAAFAIAWRHQHVATLTRMTSLAWNDFMDIAEDEAQRLRALPSEHRLMETVQALTQTTGLPDDWEQRLSVALAHDRQSLNVERQAFAFRTPLATAVVANHVPLVKRLLQEGANVNQTIALHNLAVDMRGETPVHSGYDEHGNTVFFRLWNDSATRGVKEEFVHWQDGAISPLYLAASLDNLPLCTLLLDHGADLDQRSTNVRPWRLANVSVSRDDAAPEDGERYQIDMPYEELQQRLEPYRATGGLRVMDVMKIQGMTVLHNHLEAHVLKRSLPSEQDALPSFRSPPRL